MNIAFTKHTLSNGLDVLLHEDHACPIVAVNLWYHVGPANEEPGRTMRPGPCKAVANMLRRALISPGCST